MLSINVMEAIPVQRLLRDATDYVIASIARQTITPLTNKSDGPFSERLPRPSSPRNDSSTEALYRAGIGPVGIHNLQVKMEKT
jgi:hypothetical protein